ncbi:MAG: DsbA family protein [Mesorhizobium sp.]
MKTTILIGAAGIAIAAAMLGAGYYAGSHVAVSGAATTDRAAVEKIVRDYMIANPEIMVETQAALEAKQEAQQREKQTAALNASKADIFNLATDPIAGNPNGEITLVEFYDYNCGYCKRAFPEVNALIEANPDLRVVLKEFPILGPDSQRAHQVSMAFNAVMPEKWMEFHDSLMAAPGRASEDSAFALAVALGADEAALRQAMSAPGIVEQVRTNYNLADALGITGTPSFVIGNDVIFGAVGKDALQERITAERDQPSG